MSIRLERNLFLLLVVLATAGCVIPAPQEAPFKPDVTQPIEIGKSTRDDVLFTLGVPQLVNESQDLFAYTGTQLHAFLIIGAYYHAEAVPIFTRHNLIVAFDKEGRVEEVRRVTGSPVGYCLADDRCFARPEDHRPPSLITVRQRWKQVVAERTEARRRDREQLLPRARQGETEAQFAMADNADSPAERWRWLCLAAHGGHARAQHWMAARLLAGASTGAPADKVTAYVWYALAARHGDAAAGATSEQLRADMTAEERRQAQRRLADWAADPASCNGPGTAS